MHTTKHRSDKTAARKRRNFEEKDSRRWLCGAESASALIAAGAACVTVIEDREGDIYECFAYKPAGVEKLVRAAQDRRLADGSSVFGKADGSSVSASAIAAGNCDTATLRISQGARANSP